MVLEAAAAGKPLITTKVGGIPEIYGPMTDKLVPPRDPPALAQAIVRALDHPAEAADTAQKLRDRVRVLFRSTPWWTGCCPPMRRLSKPCTRPAGVNRILRIADKPFLRLFP